MKTLKHPQKITDTIITWLNEQLKISNTKGFVVGISGGIDSALVSTLCAMTGQATLVMSLPIHQQVEQLVRSNNHAEWLLSKRSNVTKIEINLSNACFYFEDSILQSFNKMMGIDTLEWHSNNLVCANIRSRLRMIALYAHANAHNFLVVGTGNKVEDFGIGFFTKYGDGGVDISPIGDLLKSQVKALAAYLGINKDIIEAIPTDGLWGDNRSDEDQIGASYDELEVAMDAFSIFDFDFFNGYKDKLGYVNEGMSERQQKANRIYLDRHQKNLHKMKTPPICKIPEEYL